MKRTFLFTFKVLPGEGERPSWNTYQFLVESINGKIPELDTLIDLAERRWKAKGIELQYLCHSEFKDEEDVKNLLGRMIDAAEVYQLDNNDILKFKKRGQ